MKKNFTQLEFSFSVEKLCKMKISNFFQIHKNNFMYIEPNKGKGFRSKIILQLGLRGAKPLRSARESLYLISDFHRKVILKTRFIGF